MTSLVLFVFVGNSMYRRFVGFNHIWGVSDEITAMSPIVIIVFSGLLEPQLTNINISSNRCTYQDLFFSCVCLASANLTTAKKGTVTNTTTEKNNHSCNTAFIHSDKHTWNKNKQLDWRVIKFNRNLTRCKHVFVELDYLVIDNNWAL